MEAFRSFIRYWYQVGVASFKAIPKTIDVRGNVLSGCALLVIILVISYLSSLAILDNTVLSTLLSDLKSEYRVIPIYVFVAGLLVVLINFAYMPAKMHKKLGGFDDGIDVEVIHSRLLLPDGEYRKTKWLGIEITRNGPHQLRNAFVAIEGAELRVIAPDERYEDTEQQLDLVGHPRLRWNDVNRMSDDGTLTIDGHGGKAALRIVEIKPSFLVIRDSSENERRIRTGGKDLLLALLGNRMKLEMTAGFRYGITIRISGEVGENQENAFPSETRRYELVIEANQLELKETI